MKEVWVDFKDLGVLGGNTFVVNADGVSRLNFTSTLFGGRFECFPKINLEIFRGTISLNGARIGNYPSLLFGFFINYDEFSLGGDNYLVETSFGDGCISKITKNGTVISEGICEPLESILFQQSGGVVRYRFKDECYLIPSILAIYSAYVHNVLDVDG